MYPSVAYPLSRGMTGWLVAYGVCGCIKPTSYLPIFSLLGNSLGRLVASSNSEVRYDSYASGVIVAHMSV